MAMQEARYSPLEAADMSEEQRAVAAEIAAGPRGRIVGPFIPLLHHPKIASRIQKLGESLRFDSSLPRPLIELAILVTARRWTCQLEWYAHEKLARTAGLSTDIIEAIAAKRRPEMDKQEAAVYDFAMQLHATGTPDDATFSAARELFGVEGTLELIALCGYYTLLAMVLNTARMPLPDGAAHPLS